MWADNETDLDLLGFDELVDELVVALTTPNLQPLTVGLLGDWGSGKSSLLKIVRSELLQEGASNGAPSYVCVEFSPWLYEDYDDVKTAMMSAVLEACRERATSPAAKARVERLGGALSRLRRYARRAGRGVLTAAPAAAPALLAAVDPSIIGTDASAATALVGLAAPAAAAALVDPAEPAQQTDITDLASFRAEFGRLVSELDDVEAVVLLIDDVDRCLPDTVADVFETIRLFLNSPKTASVIAASRTIVETAIDSRYPALQREDGRGVGHDYLEKMLQLQVVVPPLSTDQTISYLNLLIVQLHLDPGAFRGLCTDLRGRRASDAFAPTFTVAAAREALGEALTTEVEQDLSWTSELGTALGFLRGNPRQIKRFMNDLTWRRRAAARRSVELRTDVLAKLMVLEEQDEADFQTLFDWQLRVNGPSPEIVHAEARVRGADDGVTSDENEQSSARPNTRLRPVEEREEPAPPDAVSAAVEPWLARGRTRTWLALPPQLESVDLRPYFSYFRDRLVVGSATAALRSDLQLLVNQLLSDVPAIYRPSLNQITSLPEPDQDAVTAALIDTMLRRPDGPALLPTAELASRLPRVAEDICAAIGRIPHRSLPIAKIPGVAQRLGDVPGVAGLLSGWSASPVPAVATTANIARRPRAGS